MKKDFFGSVSTIGQSRDTTTVSFGRKYIQLLFGFGFDGVRDPIHEQAVVRLTVLRLSRNNEEGSR